MSYKIKVELSAKAYSRLVQTLPLVERDSVLRELACSLRYLVADSHPTALTQIPGAQGLHLYLSLQSGPEAVLVRIFGRDVVVFVDGYKDEGKVIGVCSVESAAFRHLFGRVELELLEEVNRRIPFNQTPNWANWKDYCQEWGFDPNCLSNLIPAANERGFEEWSRELERELA